MRVCLHLSRINTLFNARTSKPSPPSAPLALCRQTPKTKNTQQNIKCTDNKTRSGQKKKKRERIGFEKQVGEREREREKKEQVACLLNNCMSNAGTMGE
jgi:hypothetical protein